MTMNYEVKATGDSVIAKALAASVLDVIKGNKKKNVTAEVMRKIITRSLAKTGGKIRMAIKKGMQSELPIEDRAINPDGINIAATISANRPDGARRAKGRKPRLVRGGQLRPARRLAGAIRYGFLDKTEQEMTTGLLDPSMLTGQQPEGLKAENARAWRKRFAMFQEEGEIDISSYRNASERSMFAYFRAIGIAQSRRPRRPARPIVKPIEDRENPMKLFETNFLERLNK